MLSSSEIRNEFIAFFEALEHRHVPSSPVVLRDDPTLLFANAGMNQFKDVFLGIGSRPYNRAVNSQKCIRVSGKHNDLEEVGVDTYHHTFFEMLGNWSFGDYFKAEAIEWAWELLTKRWGLPKDRLYATVFGGDDEMGLPPDDEAAELWAKVTDIDPSHIQKWGMKDNFWQMAETGPCGVNSEIHIDLTPDKTGGKLVNAEDPRVIELWNLVFIQFDRDASGKLSTLPAKHVDTGMGFERVCAVLKHLSDIRDAKAFSFSTYGTDLIVPLIQHVEQLAGCTYGQSRGDGADRYDSNDVESITDIACRVIADHVRMISFAIADGVLPSNEGRGYVIRRLLRRAARYGRRLEMHDPFIYTLVPVLADVMGDAFAELKNNTDVIAETIRSEEEAFGRTLDRGLDIFEDVAKRMESSGKKVFPGKEAFQLYDTYGFPLDLTQLMARERGLTVDQSQFDVLMEEQRSRGRQASKVGGTGPELAEGLDLPATDDHFKYVVKPLTARLLGWVVNGEWVSEGQLREGQSAGLVTDRVCFYAESGGQVGDRGTVSGGQGQFLVDDTQWVNDQTVLLKGTVARGHLTCGEDVTLEVDRRRADTMNNHTATHILQWALRTVLGEHVKQAGSMVCDEYLRFDFTHNKAMTTEQIAEVERMVIEKIDEAHPVLSQEMPMQEALELGVMALFGEKYGERVRVLALGADRAEDISLCFSRELCGGTHVTNTSSIMDFKIIREESLQTGVRRITAKTGRALRELLHERYTAVTGLSQTLKVPADQVGSRVEALLEENRKLKKQLRSGPAHVDVAAAVNALLDNSAAVGSARVVVGELPAVPVEKIRAQIDRLKKKVKSIVMVFGTRNDEKVLLIAAVSDDLIKRGLSAGEIVQQIATIVGGGGGGKAHLAQAGGKVPDKLEEALTQAKTLIRATLED